MLDSEIYSNPYITKSIGYINNNINKKLTIDEICQYIHLSKFYFLRIFKKEVGVTPYRYILDCKVEGVKNDLYIGIDINTLVDKYGFYDLSHLNKSFIKIYKITPLEYMKSYRNKW
ncbi:MAG TPA: hypothetical protein DDY58_16390 [Terrisporobacter glycolicus]|uniref:helix-turn-helix domain-containing protein n=1 Tax=Terrisporobacter TaxID=1505652 RepID=UPI000E863B24|nr:MULTISPECIES: AraC family transcriptional regulator [Terrisporobacter]HBI93870.1 hypothetical protein [Terrisporobacter hibernicus]